MCPAYHSESLDHLLDSRLRVNQLLKDLPPQTLRAFNNVKLLSSYPKGSIVFRENQLPKGVYLLSQGRARLTLDANGKRERVIRRAGPGDVLGLCATIANKPYEVSVETLTVCHVDFIRRQEFLRLLQEQPELCFRVVQLLGQNLHVSYEQFHLFERAPSAAVKLAQLLLDWCDKAEETVDGARLKIPLTHEGIARMIGTSRETVTRTFSDFRQKQIISPEGSALLIRKRAELEKLTEPDPHNRLPN